MTGMVVRDKEISDHETQTETIEISSSNCQTDKIKIEDE